MKTLLKNKEFLLLLFLGLFSFSNGAFSNYRDLWLNSNNLTTSNIANITSVASIITVLIFLIFTLGVSMKKQKNAITIILILKMITSTSLIFLNESNNIHLIKFLTFYDIAFIELILASIYPLMINISKSDVTYTKKDTVESLFTKIGFLIVSLLLGRTMGNYIFDYNTCLLLSVIFNFLSLIVFININIDIKSKKNYLDISNAIKYLNQHKILYLYLLCNSLASLIWYSVVGMPLLSLTLNLGFPTQIASFIILIFGIITNILAIITVKFLKAKNDSINMFFKFGFRLMLYLLVFIFNSKVLLILTFIYLLIFEIPYGFLFGSYFINKVPDQYLFLITTLKYCTTLLGKGIGVFICGQVFNFDLRYLVLPALIVGIVHYILGTYILNRREKVKF